MTQLGLFEERIRTKVPPSTRYQGSKLKLANWILHTIANLKYTSVLDVFGGTGSISYALKSMGKVVSYNDYLKFNYLIGLALIENSSFTLSNDEVEFILRRNIHWKYDNVIERNFADIYFTDEENVWLDIVSQNIAELGCIYKQAVAYSALFQSCIIKRPYNLFHRKNLYMRTQEVKRSFGNKKTWDTSFEVHFRNFVHEINNSIFDSGARCKALCLDALEIPQKYDLVYIDSPYLNKKGLGVDYHDFYHFLEGISDYHNWEKQIDFSRKHRPLRKRESTWDDPRQIGNAFRALLRRHHESILVLSYRSDGIPSELDLVEYVREVKQDVEVSHYGSYKYALSKNVDSREILIVGR